MSAFTLLKELRSVKEVNAFACLWMYLRMSASLAFEGDTKRVMGECARVAILPTRIMGTSNQAFCLFAGGLSPATIIVTYGVQDIPCSLS